MYLNLEETFRIFDFIRTFLLEAVKRYQVDYVILAVAKVSTPDPGMIEYLLI